MTQTNLPRLVALCAGFGATMVALMVGISVQNGTGFQDFESILRHGTPEAYGAAIADAAPVLRLIYPLDTMYIFSYVTMVFALVQLVPERRMAGLLAVIAVLMTAGLDFIENNHILAIAAAAERGVLPDMARITFETVVTQSKFNFGLLLTLTLSFLILQDGRAADVTRWLARAVVALAPVALLSPVTTLIYLSMNIGLSYLIAYLYWPRSSQSMPLQTTAA